MAKYEVKDGVGIIPEWATEIEVKAFEDCKELTSLEFPLWIKKIGDYAFSNCSSLTEVRIPKGCNVHEDAFEDCPNVQIIRY